MQYEMQVLTEEQKEQLIRFLSDRKERIEFPPQLYSMLQDMGEAIALAVLTKGPEAACSSASSS